LTICPYCKKESEDYKHEVTLPVKINGTLIIGYDAVKFQLGDKSVFLLDSMMESLDHHKTQTPKELAEHFLKDLRLNVEDY